MSFNRNSEAVETIEYFDFRTKVLKESLKYFAEFPEKFTLISLGVNLAYSNDILFEEFNLWFQKEIDDTALSQNITYYLKTMDKKPLPDKRRNLTNKPKAIKRIKQNADDDIAKRFSRKLKLLATKGGLTTNKRLGSFLGISAERARVLLSGKHKPQRATLKKVAKAFKIPLEQLIFLGK